MSTPANTAPKMTPQAYMDLLTTRKDEYLADHPARPGFPPLLEWFIRPGDEDLVDLDAIADADTPKPTPPRRARRYRSAAQIRADLQRVEDRLSTLNESGHLTTTRDRAAYTGIGIRQTPRQRAAHGASLDRIAAEVVRLNARRSTLRARLARATAREASAGTPNP